MSVAHENQGCNKDKSADLQVMKLQSLTVLQFEVCSTF